jgi:hypothetical protein
MGIAVMLGFVNFLGGFIFGYNTGIINGILPILEDHPIEGGSDLSIFKENEDNVLPRKG